MLQDVTALIRNDISRFFSVHEELFALNCQQSSIDKALFHFYDGSKLVGLLLLHVDDFLYANYNFNPERFGTKMLITGRQEARWS